jgi:RNA polymerase sigma factor (sigma-70 family)
MLRYNPEEAWYDEEFDESGDFSDYGQSVEDDEAAKWLETNFPEQIEQVEVEEPTKGRKKEPSSKQPVTRKTVLVFPDDDEVIKLVLEIEDKFSQDEDLLYLVQSRPRNPEARSARLRQINTILRKSKRFDRLMALYTPFVDAPVVKEIYKIGTGKGEEGKTARILQQSGEFGDFVLQMRAEVFAALASAIARGTFTQDRDRPSIDGQWYDAQVEDIPKRVRTWIYSTAKNRVLKWLDRRVRLAKSGLATQFLVGEDIEKVSASGQEAFDPRTSVTEQERQFGEIEAQRRIDRFSVDQARKIKSAGLPRRLKEGLTQDQQDVLQLRVAGFTYEEIAETTGLPRGTVGRIVKEVRELIEESVGIRLSQRLSEDELIAAAEAGVDSLEEAGVRLLVGAEAEKQLVNDILTVFPKDMLQMFLDGTKETMQLEAEAAVRSAFERLGTTYEEFENASAGEQRRLSDLLKTQGITPTIGAHAAGRIESSEVKAAFREKVLDSIRRGRRGRPARKNDGGFDSLIYRALGQYPMLIVETPDDVRDSFQRGFIDKDQADCCLWVLCALS